LLAERLTHIRPFTSFFCLFECEPSSSEPPNNTAAAAGNYTDSPDEESGSFDCVLCGDETIRGSRIRVGRNTFVSLCGNTVVDMREMTQQQSTGPFHFIIVRLCGDVRMFVPRGAAVTLRRISLCGSKDIDIADDNEANRHNTPGIKVTVVTLCGDVRIQN